MKIFVWYMCNIFIIIIIYYLRISYDMLNTGIDMVVTDYMIQSP